MFEELLPSEEITFWVFTAGFLEMAVILSWILFCALLIVGCGYSYRLLTTDGRKRLSFSAAAHLPGGMLNLIVSRQHRPITANYHAQSAATKLAFGADMFSWLAIESVLLHRLYTASALAPALRPTLGISNCPARGRESISGISRTDWARCRTRKRGHSRARTRWLAASGVGVSRR